MVFFKEMTAELDLEGSFPGDRQEKKTTFQTGWQGEPVQESGRVRYPTEKQIRLYMCICR